MPSHAVHDLHDLRQAADREAGIFELATARRLRELATASKKSMSDPPSKKAKPDPYAKWQSARDEKTGAVYYYHVDTKKTSWTWPPPLDDGDKADTPSSDVPEFEASATYQGRRPGRVFKRCLLYTSPSPRDATLSRMPSSA